MFYYAIFNSPFGNIYIQNDSSYILRVSFVQKSCCFFGNSLTSLAIDQLNQYFFSARKYFDLPLNPFGTPFQKKVWAELLNIPYASTLSYKDIAIKINNPFSYRAVGNANNKNPISIIIPCHRVISSDKKLSGYSAGQHIKRSLLSLESSFNLYP